MKTLIHFKPQVYKFMNGLLRLMIPELAITTIKVQEVILIPLPIYKVNNKHLKNYHETQY
jgi:hypothetical protein